MSANDLERSFLPLASEERLVLPVNRERSGVCGEPYSEVDRVVIEVDEVAEKLDVRD